MNTLRMCATLTLGLLALVPAAGPAHAQEYIVEPIVDSGEAYVDNVQATDEQGFSEGELDQMLAPIALYPDALLSQVLMAATYPLEIVEAARWSRQNPQLEGEDAVAAVTDRAWDPSVKALVAFPDLLARMDEDLDWTRSLGDAMLFQEADVMDSIQVLRARADAAGSLDSTEHVRVIREQETIIIEPAETRVVHVPYYDPYVVYGSWWRPAYPPVVWARPSYYYYGSPGFYWSTGIHFSSSYFYSGFYWPQRSLVIVNAPTYYYPRYHHPSRAYYAPGQRWKHNPAHRRGVAYRHHKVKQHYDQPRLKAGPATRWPLSGATTHNRRPSASSGSRGTNSSRDASHDTRRGDDYGSRWSAGARSSRPDAARTDRRVGDRRSFDAPRQRTAASSTPRGASPTQRGVSPAQRKAAPQRDASPGRRAAAAPAGRVASASQRATTVRQQTSARTQRQASSPPRANARAAPQPQARPPQGRASRAAAAAPAPQARVSSRSAGRSADARPASRSRGSPAAQDTRRGQPGQAGRRRD